MATECDHEADALQHLQAANTAVTRLAGQLAAARDELGALAMAIVLSDDPCPACGVHIAPEQDHGEACPLWGFSAKWETTDGD